MELLIRKVNILLILAVYISKDTIFAQIIEDTGSLELVAILHRHGDRAPLHFYKNDPYKDEKKYWPNGLGQLTNEGKRKLYNLGKVFREEYKTFIPKYSAQAVRVNSSDMDRAHMSAAALLAGMFPPEGNQIWNDQLIWQPIPIHSVPNTQDKILAPLAPCPRFWAEHKKVLSLLSKLETPKDKKMYKYLTKYTGQNITSVCEALSIYDTLLVEERNGFILPQWTKNVYPYRLLEKASICPSTFTWNNIMKRIFGGPMVKEIVHQFQEKSEGRIKDMKLFLYSAHDTTIISLFRALNFKNYLLPDYGASIIFELHKKNNKYYVKMFYAHSAEIVPYEVEIPKCIVPCPLHKLSHITQYVRSVNWDTQCFEQKDD
ncbi:testicular acid phosphatase homolog [Lycorma delicatula]|uniref:testicular acid phosphatase homolog n=1 Tax=Lycorma delicatula TaxID=130591 RepID=UPI003F51151F